MTGDMNAREYSTRSRARRTPETVAHVMAAAARLGPDGRGRFLAPAALQSWPGIVHGGGLVALLDAAARALGSGDGPRRLEGRLTSSVPIETALDLEGHAERDVATVTILERAQPLTSATVDAGAVETDPAEATPAEWTAAGREGWPMPLSDQCLACGAHNALGLQLGLRWDRDGVWARFRPRAPWRGPGDRIDPALAPVLLDELAWWLGALVTKEGGLTNRISVTLLRPDAAGPGPITAVGRFADVTPVDRRRIFWRTRSGLLAADGTLLAVASIVFRPGAEYSARQMSFFRARTDPENFARMFPGYAG
jgi:acyl-coenzyme A thioesterase PaaI-like protein